MLLPSPSQAELDRSEQLAKQIKRQVSEHHNALPFSLFVEACLYTPNLGYYESGDSIFGPEGDFVTAPELSPIFAHALAEQYSTLVKNGLANQIIEIGAGSGSLCREILLSLFQTDSAPDAYYILEKSNQLRERQRVHLQRSLPEHLYRRIIWTEAEQVCDFCGFIIANEVFDALPFDLFEIRRNTVYELVVALDNAGQFALRQTRPREQLKLAISHEVPLLDTDYYCSEICLGTEAFLKALVQRCRSAIFCIIDYGHTRAEYYHPDRKMGTMICHYKHRAHTDPLLWPGIQDITCNVNFSQIASCADELGMDVLCYSPLTHFLLANGITSDINSNELQNPLSDTSQNLKKLLLPTEMGERFQVLMLGKDANVGNVLLSLRDFRYKL